MFVLQWLIAAAIFLAFPVLLGYIFCKLTDWYYEGKKPWKDWRI